MPAKPRKPTPSDMERNTAGKLRKKCRAGDERGPNGRCRKIPKRSPSCASGKKRFKACKSKVTADVMRRFRDGRGDEALKLHQRTVVNPKQALAYALDHARKVCIGAGIDTGACQCKRHSIRHTARKHCNSAACKARMAEGPCHKIPMHVKNKTRKVPVYDAGMCLGETRKGKDGNTYLSMKTERGARWKKIVVVSATVKVERRKKA